jgi:hypothetical protein
MRLPALLSGILVVALTAAPGAVRAQDARSLAAGVTVRVRGLYATEHGDRVYVREGRLVGTDSATLVLDHQSRMDTLPFFAMKRLEVHQGEVARDRLVQLGALTGALTGAALWGVVKLISSQDDGRLLGSDGKLTNHKGYGQLERLTLIGIPVLTGVGAAIGATSSRDLWIRVSIPGALHPDP